MSALLHTLLFLIPVALPVKAVPTKIAFYMLPPDKPAPEVKKQIIPPKPKPRPKKKRVVKPVVKNAIVPEEQIVQKPPEEVEVEPEPEEAPPAESAVAEPVGPVRTVFGEADAPQFLHRVMPRYPSIARRRGKEGYVMLRLTIDAQGQLQHVEVIEATTRAFADAAVKAARKSRFLPAKKNGRPLLVQADLPIHFRLRR